MLTIPSNLAYIHQGLQGWLSDLLVNNWQKAFYLKHYYALWNVLYVVNMQKV